MSKVDVVIPCYNYARYLRECVHSVLSQPGVDVRALVIDDASSDETAQVGYELAESDPRVEFHRHHKNKGHIATYNEGLALVSADYVVLLSADDLLTPGALKRATDLMTAHPSVGFVYGFPKAFQTASPPPAETRVSGWTVWNGREWMKLMCRKGKNFIHSPEVVMRADIQRAIGGYRPSLPHSGDMEMWLRAAAVSDVGRVNGADQAYYRVHASNMHRTSYAGFLVDLQGRHDAFRSAFEGPVKGIPDAGLLFELAKRSLAASAVRHACQAHDRGRAELEPVEGYLEFARSLFPGVVTTRQWRGLERRRGQRRGAILRMVDRARARAREFLDGRSVRRWVRTGLF
ncbi:MAG TPA: glycosyltransferase family A protein [Myxococcota bacterium]|nr:glycosyltransferase family A protein [Myxococcota bacterium]